MFVSHLAGQQLETVLYISDQNVSCFKDTSCCEKKNKQRYNWKHINLKEPYAFKHARTMAPI